MGGEGSKSTYEKLAHTHLVTAHHQSARADVCVGCRLKYCVDVDKRSIHNSALVNKFSISLNAKLASKQLLNQRYNM